MSIKNSRVKDTQEFRSRAGILARHVNTFEDGSVQLWWGLLLLAIPTIIGAVWFFDSHRAVSQPKPPVVTGPFVSRADFIEQSGIEITHVAPAADGGMVDFGYRVVDPAKAARFLNDPANKPALIVTETGQQLNPTQIGGRPRGGAGRGAVPFNFFPNVNHAVKEGTKVSVAFGALRVEPIEAGPGAANKP